MADSTTTNLLLTKPEVGASTDTWGTKLNTDMGLIDSVFDAAGTGTSVGLNIGTGKTLTLAGTVKFAGSTSGTTTVAATAVAGTTVLTLPAATDTLVGKATTDTLTNKTLTGAVMNGTVGATTPATGAFTTLSATGDITQSNAAARIAFSSAAGNGGLQNDTASAYALLYGSTHATLAKNVVLNSDGGAVRIKSTGTDIGVFTSTGLAVTGTLSATGTLSGGTSGTGYSFSGSAPAGSLALDSSGNLGLGVTPSAFGSGSYKALQIGGSLSFMGRSGGSDAYMMSNTYFDQTNYRYVASLAASRYTQSGGEHQWFNAPSGTAGNAITFTQAMTLDASGNLEIGGTFAQGRKLAVDSSTNGYTMQLLQTSAFGSGNLAGTVYSGYYDGSSITDMASIRGGKENATSGNYAGMLAFYTRPNGGSDTERARIDSSGNLLVGTTSQTYSGKQELNFTTGRGLVINYTTNTSAVAAVYFRNSGGNTGEITVTGVATTYNSVSDYRLKTVIGAVSGSGNRIDALQPVEYTWNSNGLRTRGFLAHQFQEVYVSSVTGSKDAVDADGKPVYQSMQSSNSEVIADLVAELQSLRARVAQLESKP